MALNDWNHIKVYADGRGRVIKAIEPLVVSDATPVRFEGSATVPVQDDQGRQQMAQIPGFPIVAATIEDAIKNFEPELRKFFEAQQSKIQVVGALPSQIQI